jgi:TctA family transporter
MYLGNVVAVIMVLATVPLFAAILRIPFSIIGPVIVVVCFIGAYTVGSSRFDLWLALAFGLAGYGLKKLDYPIAPLVLAMILGDKAEDAFRQSMIMSRGSLSIFWSNGLVATLVALALLLLLSPLLTAALRRVLPKRRLADTLEG